MILRRLPSLLPLMFMFMAAAGAALPASAAGVPEPARIYAAASLTEAVTELAGRWAAHGQAAPVTVFAASSTLARQIEAGAPPGIFMSADRSWMDHLAQRGRLVPGSRIDRLGNVLVLIAPQGRAPAGVKLEPGADLAHRFAGRLCTGEPGAVPLGRYAQQALTALGAWPALSQRLVGADDARTALAFVERGECALGIVYATDAASSRKVEVVGVFAEGSHAPIVYPFALTQGAPAAARALFEHLRTPAAGVVFARHGFTVLAD